MPTTIPFIMLERSPGERRPALEWYYVLHKTLDILTLTLLVAIRRWPVQNHANILKNHWNHGIWVLVWEYSMRAIQWVPTWQGFSNFREYLRSCVLDESSLSIELATSSIRVKEGKSSLRFSEWLPTACQEFSLKFVRTDDAKNYTI